jgi:phosphatidylserine/phosphatidylglycerophosphate/cardiolipin synthase-like enzyme
VLVSSQNWSTDGTLYNRDAVVILYHPQAARYFQQIFLHDWQHLATNKALPD